MKSYILCLFCDCIVFTEKDWSKFDSLLEINNQIIEGKGWHFDKKIVSSKYCRFCMFAIADKYKSITAHLEMICSRIYKYHESSIHELSIV